MKEKKNTINVHKKNVKKNNYITNHVHDQLIEVRRLINLEGKEQKKNTSGFREAWIFNKDNYGFENLKNWKYSISYKL